MSLRVDDDNDDDDNNNDDDGDDDDDDDDEEEEEEEEGGARTGKSDYDDDDGDNGDDDDDDDDDDEKEGGDGDDGGGDDHDGNDEEEQEKRDNEERYEDDDGKKCDDIKVRATTMTIMLLLLLMMMVMMVMVMMMVMMVMVMMMAMLMMITRRKERKRTKRRDEEEQEKDENQDDTCGTNPDLESSRQKTVDSRQKPTTPVRESKAENENCERPAERGGACLEAGEAPSSSSSSRETPAGKLSVCSDGDVLLVPLQQSLEGRTQLESFYGSGACIAGRELGLGSGSHDTDQLGSASQDADRLGSGSQDAYRLGSENDTHDLEGERAVGSGNAGNSNSVVVSPLESEDRIQPLVFYSSKNKNKTLEMMRLFWRIQSDLQGQPDKEADVNRGAKMWQIFPRQDMAFQFCDAHQQEAGGGKLSVFVFEEHFMGQRRFLVTTYEEFWRRYNHMAPDHRHHYEIIREGCACVRYFDLEFNRAANPDADGESMVDDFLSLLGDALLQKFSVKFQKEWTLELDSTTKDKFSRHLVIRIPDRAFKSNIHVGAFVAEVVDGIRCKKEVDERCAHMFVRKESSADMTGSQRSEDGRMVASAIVFIDLAVYSRNRCFRLLLSSKAGKKSVLLPTDRFRCEGGMKMEAAFFESLICNVDDQSAQNLISCAAEDERGFAAVKAWGNSGRDRLDGVGGAISVSQSQKLSSPFPAVDDFITEVASVDQCPATIRGCFWVEEYFVIVYNMMGNRFCENIGRQHKGNNVMYIVDFRVPGYYQKCHDPDCRGFRSPMRPLPLSMVPDLPGLDKLSSIWSKHIHPASEINYNSAMIAEKRSQLQTKCDISSQAPLPRGEIALAQSHEQAAEGSDCTKRTAAVGGSVLLLAGGHSAEHGLLLAEDDCPKSVNPIGVAPRRQVVEGSVNLTRVGDDSTRRGGGLGVSGVGDGSRNVSVSKRDDDLRQRRSNGDGECRRGVVDARETPASASADCPQPSLANSRNKRSSGDDGGRVVVDPCETSSASASADCLLPLRANSRDNHCERDVTRCGGPSQNHTRKGSASTSGVLKNSASASGTQQDSARRSQSLKEAKETEAFQCPNNYSLGSSANADKSKLKKEVAPSSQRWQPPDVCSDINANDDDWWMEVVKMTEQLEKTMTISGKKKDSANMPRDGSPVKLANGNPAEHAEVNHEDESEESDKWWEEVVRRYRTDGVAIDVVGGDQEELRHEEAMGDEEKRDEESRTHLCPTMRAKVSPLEGLH
ncbi:hypothetical protein CBR_g36403 [Chara braunii]|uniref:DNA-directed primase/polymerase protein n=1 Tax=Chara braunii TaxID=69332 RepID=A0A388LKS0_CHABU|nr:hypothetical protein CBR_g36403 [Chara braunii]|eukprot:GBG82877.1 hypothetical protein CBR_g36403 [Chara braunii]